MPGGFVVIHTGLLLEVKRPEEILGVLAHEVAQGTATLGTELVESAGLFLVVQMF